MTCMLALMCGLYIEGGLSVADGGIDEYRSTTQFVTLEKLNGHIEYVGREDTRDFTRRAANPYGRLAIGVEHVISERVRMYLESYHESSLATGKDRGVNGLRLFVRFYFFGSGG